MSAYSFREFLVAWERSANAPNDYSLKNKVIELEDHWNKFKETTDQNVFKKFTTDNSQNINNPQLLKFLNEFRDFFEEFNINRPRIDEVAKIIFDATHPTIVYVKSESWKKIKTYFNNILHHSEKIDEQEFSEYQSKLEELVGREILELNYKIYDDLDEYIQTKESDIEEIDEKIIEKINTNIITLDYFFNHITSPRWVPVLIKKGFFRKPDETLSDHYNRWPETHYLAKIADQSPEQILKILETYTDTNIACIHSDIFAACAKLPSDKIQTLIEKEIRWIQKLDKIPILTLKYILSLIDKLLLKKEYKKTKLILRAIL